LGDASGIASEVKISSRLRLNEDNAILFEIVDRTKHKGDPARRISLILTRKEADRIIDEDAEYLYKAIARLTIRRDRLLKFKRSIFQRHS
jgi:hypothetical protein